MNRKQFMETLEELLSDIPDEERDEVLDFYENYFDDAIEKADSTAMAYILPRITSCYRKSGRPQKAIDILTYASKTFGRSMITPVLLTSAAAAYCDIEDYERAKRCCDRAYAESNGMHSDELSLVYKRIKRATGE